MQQGAPRGRRSILLTRTVRAIRRDNGHLELLEPVELPRDQVITVTVEVTESVQREVAATLPTRKLGPMKTLLTRDEIYADCVR